MNLRPHEISTWNDIQNSFYFYDMPYFWVKRDIGSNKNRNVCYESK